MNWTSKICRADLAALVHMASDGNDTGDGRLGKGTKALWMIICMK